MKILSNREYDRLLTSTSTQAWVDGFNCARRHPCNTQWEREFERGRITLNEYRRLAYDLPPIEKSENIEVLNERVSRKL
jgi:hypothetical protein